MTYNQAWVDAHNDAHRHVEAGRTEPPRRTVTPISYYGWFGYSDALAVRRTLNALEAYYAACDALRAIRSARRRVAFCASRPAMRRCAETDLLYAEGRFAYFSTLCVLRSRKVLASADRPLSLFEAARLVPRPLRDAELR